MKKMLTLVLALLAIPAMADVVTIPGAGGVATAVTPGTTTVTGATSCLVRADASSLLQCSSWLGADGSGAGTPTVTFTKTMSGGATTSNLLNITGTLPTTLTAAGHAVNFQITSAGSSAQQATALNVALLPGKTSNLNLGFSSTNTAASTAATGFAGTGGNWGIQGVTNSSTAGSNIGVYGTSLNASTGDSIGVLGKDASSAGAGMKVGVAGQVSSTASASTARVGVLGLFTANASAGDSVTVTDSAALFDNTTEAVPILTLRDNGTVVASVADGGAFITGSSATAANAVSIQETAGQITFEGATSNSFQTRITARDPTADNTVTLPDGTGIVPVIGRVAADVSTTSGTNYSDVTGLTFAVAANTSYSISCDLMYSTAATTTALRLAVNGPASPTAVNINSFVIASSTAFGSFYATAYDSDNAFTTGGGATVYPATLIGTVENGANAGTLAVRIKSEVDTSAVTIKRGSFCTLY